MPRLTWPINGPHGLLSPLDRPSLIRRRQPEKSTLLCGVVRTTMTLSCGAVFAVIFATSATAVWGVYPRPLFRTPASAAYCYVEATSQEDLAPKLFCWTPNDGWAVEINWRARRARTAYYTKRPPIVHSYGILKGYRPRGRTLHFGQRWVWRCATMSHADRCGVREGPIAFRCVSRTTGLTCTNAADHGFWIGRFRGYRLF